MSAVLTRLVRSRRGSVALLAALTVIPLIGMAALGTEAGGWYITKRHAQNAADSAAYAGALQLALDSASTNVATQGREFAAQNGFCTQGDANYTGSLCGTLASGTTQTVQINVGTFAGGVFTTSAGGKAVQSIVTQSQPPLLASLFLTGNVNIVSAAVAQIGKAQQTCVLALTGGLTLGGNSQINANNCSLMSNASVKFDSSETFNGSGQAIDAVTGCTPSNTCGGVSIPHNWSSLPAVNPLASSLVPSVFPTPSGADQSAKKGILALTPGNYGTLTIHNNDSVTLAPGTYFFKSLSMDGGSLSGSNVNIVFLGSPGLKVTGGAINLTAAANNTTYPALDDILIYDEGSQSVTLNGNGSSALGGLMYFPNANVTWGGGAASNNNCSGIIAKSVTITGTSSFATSGCPASSVPYTQVVLLVQ